MKVSAAVAPLTPESRRGRPTIGMSLLQLQAAAAPLQQSQHASEAEGRVHTRCVPTDATQPPITWSTLPSTRNSLQTLPIGPVSPR